MPLESNEFSDLSAIGAHCENCGRRRRLSRSHMRTYLSLGIVTIEQLGRKLYCAECRHKGERDKNVSLVPYLRSDPFPGSPRS